MHKNNKQEKAQEKNNKNFSYLDNTIKLLCDQSLILVFGFFSGFVLPSL